MRLSGLWLVILLAAGTAPLSSAELAEIKKRGTLRVGVWAQSFPLLFSLKDGAPMGLDGELLQGFANLQKVKLEIVQMANAEELLTSVEGGEVDLMAGGWSDTEARRKRIDFSAEIFVSRVVALTRKPHRVVRAPDELRAEQVGMVDGTILADAAAAAGVPRSQLRSFPTLTSLPDALRKGEASAVIVPVGIAILALDRDPELQMGTFVGPSTPLAWGVQKGHPQLRGALNEYIANVRGSGTWSRLVVKYFGPHSLEILKKARAE